MKVSSTNLGYYIDKHSELVNNAKDCERALHDLGHDIRKPGGMEGAEKDTRYAVKVLLSHYRTINVDINNLRNTMVDKRI